MTDELAALLERVANESPEIRICCPRGHFIVHVDIYLNPAEDNTIIRIAPSSRHPFGAGHLGIAIVKTAGTLEDASTEAWDRGCNPGGEVGIAPLRNARKFPQRLMNRLLTTPDEIGKAKAFITAAGNRN